MGPVIAGEAPDQVLSRQTLLVSTDNITRLYLTTYDQGITGQVEQIYYVNCENCKNGVFTITAI